MDGGTITGRLEDLQGRFNLNNLIDEHGREDKLSRQQFERLLNLLDIDPALVGGVIDWLDPDTDMRFPNGGEDVTYLAMDPPYRTANAMLTSPSELMAVAGSCYDPDPSDAVTFFAPAQGVHDPIMARALVISNGKTKTAFLKLDTIGVSRQTHDDLAPIANSLGIPTENFIVCGTHTQSGPGAVSSQKLWELLAADCFNQRAYDSLKAGCEAALRQADAALRPAEIGIGRAFETNASRNRRDRPGIYDPEMGVLKVVEAGNGSPIAALINFAVHGTAFGGGNMLFNPSAHTVMQPGDVLIAMGESSKLSQLEAQLTGARN